MYCLVNISNSQVCGYSNENNYVIDEGQKVYEIDEYGENFLASTPDTYSIYFDGEKWWREAPPRTTEEIDQDVEDLILLLAETLGTESSDE